MGQMIILSTEVINHRNILLKRKEYDKLSEILIKAAL